MSTGYFGCDLSMEQYQALRIERIAPKLLDLEPALNNTKWFDYRFLDCTQATYLYADSYRTAMKRAMVRRKDIYAGNAWNVFPITMLVPDLDEHGVQRLYKKNCPGGNKGDGKLKEVCDPDVFHCKDAYVTSIWKGRQMADRLGIPYTIYCAAAIKYHEVMKWKNYTQPQAMFSTAKKLNKNDEPIKTIVESIVEYWEALCDTKVMASDLDQYKVCNYEGHPYQEAHVEYLLAQIARTTNKVGVVSDLVFKRVLLEPDWLEDIPNIDHEKLVIKAQRFFNETQPTEGIPA